MRFYFKSVFWIALVLIAFVGCKENNETLFIQLAPDKSGIDFENLLVETSSINIFSYEYTYNGGGVAAGDFNNDGLCDLYFTGNTVSNRLYLNQGNLKFRDVTTESNVGGRELWKTGVTAADVNGDGWLDIYVCYSGPEAGQSFSNQLFINNGCEKGGIPTFSERAKEYGLDAEGTFSTQASFFDYDRDGDLDMFLINHGNHFYSPFISTNLLRDSRHPQFGNRLYRNDGPIDIDGKTDFKFTEVSQEAGIHGGGLNFSLGVSISDVNSDGWPDIFVTNDYEEQDFLYINNQDGTFTDCTKKSFDHLSRNGMGSDVADFNNDSRPDFIELDMWPEDNFRQKLLKGPDDYYRYRLMVDSGFHHQLMRNTLQLNTGTHSDGFPVFSEIGQLAGVSSTDWSWAPLFADFDNDGFKDLFITNGYLRDFTSMDFLKYTVEEARRNAKLEGKTLELYELLSKMSSTNTSNYIFKNNGDLTFSDKTKEWGLDLPNLSFGATYADLDNDGDFEIITNNTNEPASIWVNQSISNYIRIKLVGPPLNSMGIGAKIKILNNGAPQMQEQFPTRGYQSSVDPIISFGLGSRNSVDTIQVIWPDGKQSLIVGVSANQLIEINHASSVEIDQSINSTTTTYFKNVSGTGNIDFVHRENDFVDFDREPLLPYQLSRLGPALATGDVNGDGYDDFYIGGASGQSGRLYISDGAGKFKPAANQPWTEDATKEDTGAIFFDADVDGDLDLFVVSGGNEFPVGSNQLDDRLYINQGNGKFTKAPEGSIIADHASGSCVVAADYDRDGDMDLYVAGRLLPGSFPLTTPGAILKNETDRRTGDIKFTVSTQEVNPDLRQPGMVTDALWTDFNGDNWPDLIIVGDWMPVRLFENKKGKLVEVKSSVLENATGLWKKIEAFDFDQDGDTDYVLGNSGSNLPWKVNESNPLTMFYADFNKDNRIDPIICYSAQGKSFPVASRDELFSQINTLSKKFTTYAQYGNATIEDVFDKNDIGASSKLQVQTVQSAVLENLGNGNFKLIALPVAAQVSSITGIHTQDFNYDGHPDILVAGNFYPYRTQYGRSDAGKGLLLLGNGKGAFEPVWWKQSGFYAPGDVRAISKLKGKDNRSFVLVARNNDELSLFEILKK